MFTKLNLGEKILDKNIIKVIKRVPITVIIAILAQIISLIFWAAKIDQQVKQHDKFMTDIPKMEERITEVLEKLNQLEEQFYAR